MHLFGCTHPISCHCEEQSDKAISKKRDCHACVPKHKGQCLPINRSTSVSRHAFQACHDKIKLIVVLITILSALFNFPSISGSASQEAIDSLSQKLEAWEVLEAWREVNHLLVDEPNNPELLELASRIAFQKGDYQEALKLMKQALERGGEDEKKKAFASFIEETLGVLSSFKRVESSHFVISLDERQDDILEGYLIDSLEKTYQVMAQQYGFQPVEKIRIEVFPNAKAFYLATTLSVRDIEVTGAVGITQFNKLMMLSPRALVHGYRWLDAISHEYMHYLIFKLTKNKAPIWFHEGMAKYEETRWRNGPSYLSPFYQTLLAQALSAGKLIRFEQMEPSLVRLENPEDVQLAYAEAASAIEFILMKSGHEGLQEVLRQMASANEKGAAEAIQKVLGFSFSEFEENWKGFLSSRAYQEIAGVHGHQYKIKEGKYDEERMDMEEIKSLVARNRAHLGDLLRERGRMEAAVSEYRRALIEFPNSVTIMRKLSSALATVARNEEALELLKRAKNLSPDHPGIFIALGQTYLKLKRMKEARDSFQEAIQINPFDPEAHVGLAAACETLGEKISASNEREIAHKIIQR
jgi:tetratricopeptide (TPR) repeat protein